VQSPGVRKQKPGANHVLRCKRKKDVRGPKSTPFPNKFRAAESLGPCRGESGTNGGGEPSNQTCSETCGPVNVAEAVDFTPKHQIDLCKGKVQGQQNLGNRSKKTARGLKSPPLKRTTKDVNVKLKGVVSRGGGIRGTKPRHKQARAPQKPSSWKKIPKKMQQF